MNISKQIIRLLAVSAMIMLPVLAFAQEKEFDLSGYIQVQSGIFVPLTSQLFQDYDNTAYQGYKIGKDLTIMDGSGSDKATPCDPVNVPQQPCYPTGHGGKAGKPSMMRGSILLKADWRPEERITVHAVLRIVGSLKLDLDQYAQVPAFPDDIDRRDYARDWVWRNYYNEIDLREFYVDVEATDWLSFRMGRQQVVWGDINSYRLLDVINPINSTWHFGPLESFEDTRVPLWMAKAMFEMKDIEHSLEIVWVPALDRDEDMVNVPLTFVGAWGLPLSNTPSPYKITEKKFLYPGNEFEDQRIGLRWKGNISPQSSYSLVYYYTHMLSPPIPLYYDLYSEENLPPGYIQSEDMKKLYLGFPRQHIAGFSIDYAFESPIGMVAKLEGSVEPDRTYPRTSDSPLKTDESEYRVVFDQPTFPTVNYAVQLMRPTMIRWLNPTQNILMVAQWSHSMVFGMTEIDKHDAVAIPGYNEYLLKQHSFTGVFVLATNYLHGMIAPKVVFAYIHPLSGFISTSVAFRLGRHWRLRLQVTDFFGDDPYKAVGLFRDRDEVNVAIKYQF